MSNIVVLDIILLSFIAIGIAVGLCRGFFKELVGTVGLLIAILVANVVAPMGKGYIVGYVGDDTAAVVLVWIIVFIILMLAMHGIAYLLGKLMKAVSLGWLNRLAGGLFAGLKYFMIAALIVCVCNILCNKFDGFVLKPYMEESQMVPFILRISEMIWKMF